MIGWAEEMAQLAAEFTRDFEARHGFEPGDNYVRLVDRQARPSIVQAGAPLPESLAEFYGVVAEVGLPDVHYGFFVESVESVLAGAGTVHPAKAVGAVEGDIVVFGTNGGGDLIAMTTDERVYMMSGASGPWPVLDVDEADIRAAFRNLTEFLAFLRTHLRDAVADLR
ncbi:SMI1/KNR4 family protein [Streptomycetaceae bacterium NBC_01309]